MDAVAGRLSAPLAGAQITLAGQSVDLSRTGDSAVFVDAMTGLARAFGAPGGAAASGETAPGAWPDRHGGAWDSPTASGSSPVRPVTGRELLLGNSFHLALDGEGDGGTGLTAWGRATVGGFDGQGEAETGAMRMDGEVITGILGTDTQRGRWLAGLALSVSEGEGTFEQPEAGHRGTIESNMTSVNPYLRFDASERLSTWGLLGFGTGEMTMTEAARGERGETVTRTGIEMRLAAVGARGALLDAAASGGFDLAVKADAFLVETEWEKVSNERDTQAGASRVRLVLECSRAFELSESAKLTPGLEFGLRHDGGDAETGTGVEVGGSLRYADAASGLSFEARGRTLIAHEASGFEEWGVRAAGSRSASLLAWGQRRTAWIGCGRSRMRAALRRRASLWRRGAWRRKSATGSAPSAITASRSPMRAFRLARAAHAPGAGACAGRLGRSLISVSRAAATRPPTTTIRNTASVSG